MPTNPSGRDVPQAPGAARDSRKVDDSSRVPRITFHPIMLCSVPSFLLELFPTTLVACLVSGRIVQRPSYFVQKTKHYSRHPTRPTLPTLPHPTLPSPSQTLSNPTQSNPTQPNPTSTTQPSTTQYNQTIGNPHSTNTDARATVHAEKK